MRHKLRALRQKLSPHRWKILSALALLYFVKWWWDGVQFIGPIPAPGPPKIVYVSCRDGGQLWGEIYGMNLDGSEKTLLLSPPMEDVTARVHLEHPAIRPDRRQIAFYMRSREGQSIWTMNMDGSSPKQITSYAYKSSIPSFTTDGRNIVSYASPSNFSDMPPAVCVMNTKGKRRKYVDSKENEHEEAINRTVDPVGPWIVHKPWELLHTVSTTKVPILVPEAEIVFANGSRIPLSPAIAGARDFFLSADRQKLVCSRGGQICVMSTDGANLIQPTTTSYATAPKFTPDSQQIVYKSGGDLYIMNADGTNQRQLTNTPQNEEWFDVR